MEEVTREEKRKNLGAFFYVLIIEIITISIVLVSLFIIKIFFAKTYKEIFRWYNKNFLSETNVEEIIEKTQGENYEI